MNRIKYAREINQIHINQYNGVSFICHDANCTEWERILGVHKCANCSLCYYGDFTNITYSIHREEETMP